MCKVFDKLRRGFALHAYAFNFFDMMSSFLEKHVVESISKRKYKRRERKEENNQIEQTNPFNLLISFP